MRLLAALLLLPAVGQEATLVDQLAGESPTLRERAATALRALGEDAVPQLRGALTHPDAEVRARVSELLRRIEWDGTIDPRLLSRYPELKDAFERGAHTEVLDFCHEHPASNMGFDAHFEAYAIKLLGVQDIDLRTRAAAILHQVAERPRYPSDGIRRPVRPLLTRIVGWDPELDNDPKQYGLAGLTETVFHLSSRRDRDDFLGARAGHPDARMAIDLLRAAADLDEFKPALLRALGEGPAWARPLALKIVRKVKYGPAREAVLKWVGHPELDWWAIQAIGEILDASCEAPLVEAYKKTEPSKRSWYWYVLLSKMGSPESLQLLLEAVDSCDPGHYQFIFEGLVSRRATGLFDRLCAGFEDEKLCNVFARGAGELADAKTIHRLLEMLELPKGRRRDSAFSGLRFTRDPGAQRAVLKRMEDETRPSLRKDLFSIITDYWFVIHGAEGLEQVLEKIVKTPGDPLAPEAAAHLARIRGRDGVPQAEESILATDEPSWTLIAWLGQFPSDRMVEKMGRLAEAQKEGGWAVRYLENLGTEKARKELQRVRPLLQKDRLRLIGGSYSELEDGGASKTVDQLKKILSEYVKNRTIPAAKEEVPLICGTGIFPNTTGRDVMRALGERRDRSLIPLFLERLKDPEADLQHGAIRALGKLAAKEAVPALRQLVLSGDLRTRGEAIRALGAIGGPGTAEFLRAQLRDNPHAGPWALARLGRDCRADVALLLDDTAQKGPILGALDLMANPGVYRNLDTPLPPGAPTQLEAFTSIIENRTGTPCRVSQGVRRMLRSHDQSRTSFDAETLREALEDMAGYQGYAGERFTTVFRHGVIELCLVEEALEHWKPNLPKGR